MRTRRQALGQHFLHHRPTIEKILSVASSFLPGAKAIVEVGPGALALTKDLAQMAQKASLPLFLIERDQRLEQVIRSGLEADGLAAGTELRFMDAAAPPFLEFFRELETKNIGPVLFVSNLPYSASSQILANLTVVSSQIKAAVVMVQKELADRMVANAGTKDRGSFSLLMQSYYKQSVCFDVGPGAFNPPPQVMSTVLEMHPLNPPATKGIQTPLDFERFCKQLFSQRRKMIRKLVPPHVVSHFANLGVDGTERPETLSLETVVGLYKLSVGEPGEGPWKKDATFGGDQGQD